MNVDLFSPEQGKRLFGFIAAGATVGAIVGSAVTATLALYVSPIVLLLGAAVLLEVAVFSVGRLSRLSPACTATRGLAATAGRTADRRRRVRRYRTRSRSPYLLNVSLFMLLYSITSTLLYFQQAGIVSHSIPARGAQTAFFATVDLMVDVLTLVIAAVPHRAHPAACGVALTLALLPALTIIGFGALALLPTIGAWWRFRSCAAPAISRSRGRPARCLFTVVSREDRYKAKSFIDTFVYRLGDQVGAWSSALLTVLGGGTVWRR